MPLTTASRLALAATLTAGLTVAGTTATASAAPPDRAGKPLSTELEPGQEVAPFVGVEGASGSAALRLNPGQERICVDLQVDGFDLALAHIHEGAAGTNGPVVVDFTPLIDGDTAVGCVAVDRALVKEIVQDPADYYVNTHAGLPPEDAAEGDFSSPFYEGIRGQLG